MTECRKCHAENPPGSTSCRRCGASLDQEPVPEARDRFKTWVTILIAVVSMVGALVAWRVSIASSIAADADVDGVVSIVSRNQALGTSEAAMYRNLWTFLQVRVHDFLSGQLARASQDYPSDVPGYSQMWTTSWTEGLVAEDYLQEVNIQPEYIRADGSYDGQAAQQVDMAMRSLETDFDPQGRHFSLADRMRAKVLVLMELALALTGALLFYTLAEVIRGALKYAFFALGTVVFVSVLVALALVELGLV